MSDSPKQSQSQIGKFRDFARELECDESEERFAVTVKKLGSAPPAPHRKGEKPEKKPAK